MFLKIAQNHVFYIDGFPDFTRQHMAILEHFIVNSPSVTVSLNCDRVDSKLLAFEKAGLSVNYEEWPGKSQIVMQ